MSRQSFLHESKSYKQLFEYHSKQSFSLYADKIYGVT